MSENECTTSGLPMTKPSKTTDGDDRIVVRLHKAYRSPVLAEEAFRSLECTAKDFFLDGSFGLRSKSEVHEFYDCDAEGYVCFRAGLAPRVIDDLSSVGVDAQIDDRSRWPVLEQLAVQLPGIVNDENRCLLNAVATNPRGQIVVGNSCQPQEQLLDVFSLFHNQRVLVVTRNREERDNVQALVSARTERAVSTHHNVPWGARDRVTVVTANFFSGISVLNVDFDVILFTHPNAVTGDQAYATASQLDNELIYCFTPSGFHADKLTQLRLESVCGPVIHNNRPTLPIVQVIILKAPPGPTAAAMSALERKRAIIWHNNPRNNRIARIAHAFATDDTFSHRGGFLSQYVDPSSMPTNPGIAILVESTEHGLELQRRLPGWTLHTAIPDKDGVWDDETCHRSIITQAFASHGVYVDVLIRATGSGSPLVVRGFPSVQQRRAIVLIDLADDFDAQSSRDTGERSRDYWARGWPVAVAKDQWTSQCPEADGTVQSERGARA